MTKQLSRLEAIGAFQNNCMEHLGENDYQIVLENFAGFLEAFTKAKLPDDALRNAIGQLDTACSTVSEYIADQGSTDDNETEMGMLDDIQENIDTLQGQITDWQLHKGHI